MKSFTERPRGKSWVFVIISGFWWRLTSHSLPFLSPSTFDLWEHLPEVYSVCIHTPSPTIPDVHIVCMHQLYSDHTWSLQCLHAESILSIPTIPEVYSVCMQDPFCPFRPYLKSTVSACTLHSDHTCSMRSWASMRVAITTAELVDKKHKDEAQAEHGPNVRVGIHAFMRVTCVRMTLVYCWEDIQTEWEGDKEACTWVKKKKSSTRKTQRGKKRQSGSWTSMRTKKKIMKWNSYRLHRWSSVLHSE